MKRYRQAVAALVLKPSSVCAPDDCTFVRQILLVHKPRKNDAWQLPQGGVEEGESIEQAALRELEEETGLKQVEISKLCACKYSYDYSPVSLRRFGSDYTGQALTFVFINLKGDATVTVDGKEIDAHAWVFPEDLGQYIKRKEYLEVVEKVLSECEEGKV